MRFSPSNSGRRVVAPDDPICVWMSASILSYQLCERNFDCDACPLDAAMRKHFARPGQAETGRAGSAWVGAAPAGLPAGRGYASNHTWVEAIGQTPKEHVVVRVGVEPGLAAALLTPRTLVLPAAGERLHQGRTHFWVVTEGGTFPVASPLDGVVLAVNADLGQNPHTMVDSPLEAGWVMDVDACEYELEQARLMQAEEAREKWAVTAVEFRDRLAAALCAQEPGVGPTLADGGAPLLRLSDMLGAARYFAILRRSFA